MISKYSFETMCCGSLKPNTFGISPSLGILFAIGRPRTTSATSLISGRLEDNTRWFHSLGRTRLVLSGGAWLLAFGCERESKWRSIDGLQRHSLQCKSRLIYRRPCFLGTSTDHLPRRDAILMVLLIPRTPNDSAQAPRVLRPPYALRSLRFR